ncbi:TPA: hypothetical protein ACWV6B_005006 [Salmonella enterica subsp. enterica serovar Muenchen]
MKKPVAKGLEYENVILFNMVSDESRMFRDICGDMTPTDLQQPGKYSRGKDKRDRSLELYKFYINALYVAMFTSMGAKIAQLLVITGLNSEWSGYFLHL